MEKQALAVREQQWYHYSETKWAEYKKLVCREWRTAFQLLQLAAKNEECIVAAGIRPVRGTFAQLAENSGDSSHPNHTAHSRCYPDCLSSLVFSIFTNLMSLYKDNVSR